MIYNLKIISLLAMISISSLKAINYSEDISPIIYQECTSCHRPNEIASFLPLMNYDDVYSNRYWIAYAIEGETEERHGDPVMPPWPPDRSYSSFVGERYLTDEQVHTFLDWIDEGAPQGDPILEAEIPEFPEGSTIGDPDQIFEMNEPYIIEGNYEDDYRCFIIDTGWSEDKDIAALEFRPGNSKAVHHAIIVAVPHGSVDDLDYSDAEYGYECFGGFGTNNISDMLGGYAPGTIVEEFPDGLGQFIAANSDLVVQIHYAPLNTEQTDLSLINVFFKDEPVERYVQEAAIVYPYLYLPPNQITEVEQSMDVPFDISLIQIFPHAHLLGKSWEIFSVNTTNDTIPIIRINNWNFDWQNFYVPKYMQHIPAGSTIYAKCVYDNTSENLNNPNNPPELVTWGEGTNDEMFFVPIRYVPYQDGDELIYLGNTSEFMQGDANLDNEINILDIVILVQFILEFQSPTMEQQGLSDMNNDNILNILDIVLLIDYILS